MEIDIFKAAALNNEALELEAAGDFESAEKKHLEALALKQNSVYGNPHGTALTQNGLGELYMKMGKLDEAQTMLESAYETRKRRSNFDRSCTCDNLGRLFEMKGDLKKAIEWRTLQAPSRMVCSFFECPKSKICEFSQISALKKCAKCKCVYYCGKECQQRDWSRHKQFCKVLEDVAEGASN